MLDQAACTEMAHALSFAFENSTLNRRQMNQITSDVIRKLSNTLPELDREKFLSIVFPKP